ncbi:MAG TPA: LysE family transporter [Coleofasciculaceae cyanobacterium]
MNFSFLLRGLLAGLAIAIPVGPTSILCINRALVEGFLAGLISALGAATSDALYGYIGIIGLTFVTTTLLSQQVAIHLVSSVFLFYFGLKIFLLKPTLNASRAESLRKSSAKANSLFKDYVSAFIVNSANPMAILPFAAIFTALEVENINLTPSGGVAFILGIFLGALLWGAFLSALFSGFRYKLNLYRLRWVNRMSGVMIIGFGVVMLANLIIQAPSVLN